MGVQVNPDVLTWAVHDAQPDFVVLNKKFPKLNDWLQGSSTPTFKQLEDLSKALHIPFGYMFLDKPPTKNFIESEFRTINNSLVKHPSKNLEDVLLQMERASGWMRDYRINEGFEPLKFIGSINNSDGYDTIANRAHEILDINAEQIMSLSNANSERETFGLLRNCIENLGVLVFVSGTVGSNTHRPLDINEFRAFSIVDDYAPVIFINGKDNGFGRTFSLMHEFMHLMFGTGGVTTDTSIETICNKAASEFFAPETIIRDEWNKQKDPLQQTIDMANTFKVSTHSMAIKLVSMNLITQATLQTVIEKAQEKIKKQGSGGDYWNNKLFSMSQDFVRAVIESTEGGQTVYTEAFRLLGVKKTTTYDELRSKYHYG